MQSIRVFICLALCLGGFSSCQTRGLFTNTTSAEDRKLHLVFERYFEEDLLETPEWLTQEGRSERKSEWSDQNEKEWEKDHRKALMRKEELKRFQPELLSEEARTSLELYLWKIERGIEYYKNRHYSWVLSPLFGEPNSSFEFLNLYHQVNTEADALAYVERVKGIPKILDEKKVMILNNEKITGAKAPAYFFESLLSSVQKSVEMVPVVEDLRIKLTSSSLPTIKREKILKSLDTVVQNDLNPALMNYLQFLQDRKKSAPQHMSLSKLKGGGDVYRARLKWINTYPVDPDETHALGLKEVKRIQKEILARVRREGFKGSIQDFFALIKRNPRYQFLDPKTFRDEYFQAAKQALEDIGPLIPQYFKRTPKSGFEIRAVEPYREQASPMAFYQRPSLKLNTPGVYYVNLSDMSAANRYEARSLAYHEAIPGHHFEIALAQELEGLPEFRKRFFLTGYSEGWALYAERLADEMGLYKDTPSWVGHKTMALWRAARLVVDTGLHAKGWSHKQAVEYLSRETPSGEDENKRAVARYVSDPGQATAYYLGMNKILQLREMAKQELGSAFDIREFHDEVLKRGPMPFEFVERSIKGWISLKRASSAQG